MVNKLLQKGLFQKIGKGIILKNITEYNFLTTGVMAQVALEAIKKIKEKYNINVGLVHLSTIKPLDKTLLNKVFKKSKKIITIEENVVERWIWILNS